MGARREEIYIDEATGHQDRYHRLVQFMHSSTKAAAAMLVAAIIAVCVASSSSAEAVSAFWHTELSIGFGDAAVSMTLSHIINDIFMAIFFLLVGLEIKYEMTAGELTNIRQALLSIIAAIGGVVVPIVIYLAFNATNPDTVQGWGVPTATDIAFALGIMALLGSRVPNGVRVFLSTLAVADDIIAILIIAVFYGHSPSWIWLAAAAGIMVVLILLNKAHVYALAPYLLIGAILWYCIFMSGVHATIAGVLLAFTIPTGSHINLRSFISWSGRRIDHADAAFTPEEPVIGQKDYLETISDLSRVAKKVVPPAVRLEHRLYPWVYFGILPLFALTNADVSVAGGALAAAFANPILPGVMCGLMIGKPLGILLAAALVVKLGLAQLPEHVTWHHMAGAAILGGVGFTMAIFVANLAYADPTLVAAAKMGILISSVLAGVAGFLVLLVQARKDEKAGILYVQEVPESEDADSLLAADREETQLCAENLTPPLHRE